MFLENQEKSRITSYKEVLGMVGSLSGLFSENDDPYVAYRVAENLFCASFEAENLSRSDASVDASKNRIGVGIKTFLNKNGASMQKVAEFNSYHHLFKDLDLTSKVNKISELRNERIEFTKRTYGLDEVYYHCLVRRKEEILIFETNMDLIDLGKISSVKEKKNIITFTDGLNEYSFNSSKTTLSKRFKTPDTYLSVPVEILKDPIAVLSDLLNSRKGEFALIPTEDVEHIFLPLYSTRGGKLVSEKSGPNQWNAAGRVRDLGEVYIPVPAWIHREFPEFFPEKDTSFSLILPNKEQMVAKLCQGDGKGKALMSKRNADLGKWLLRDVLNLREGELLTYEKLERIGLDSIVLTKVSEGAYEIDFAKLDSYEEFKNEFSESEKDSEELSD